jgi:hypothetical protein
MKQGEEDDLMSMIKTGLGQTKSCDCQHIEITYEAYWALAQAEMLEPEAVYFVTGAPGTSGGSSFRIVEITNEDYENLGAPDENTLYCVTGVPD